MMPIATTPAITSGVLKKRRACQITITAMEIIVGGNPLPPQYRDHPLRGEFHGSRDCHLEPDWLLIYTLNPSDPVVCFERTGTHADLFGS